MNTEQVTYPIKDRWSYLWLLIGLAMSLVSVPIGNLSIPVFFWIGSIFFIRFMRSQRRWWLAYLILAVTMGLTTFIAMPASLGSVRLSFTIGAAIVVNLLYVADRLMAPRLPGFAATLVFPLGYTALEFINTDTNPFGSYGMSVYSQAGNLALMQLVSITGMWGITFLMGWLSPIVNWAWERSFNWKVIWRGVALYAGILFLVIVFGQLRLMFAPPATDTVRVAGFTAVDFRAEIDEFHRLMDEDWEAFRQKSMAQQRLYFEETVREARAGAQIILWPEMAAPTAKEDEAILIAQAQETAREAGIYLAVPMLTEYEDDTPYENKLLIFDPSGAIVLEHFKYGGPEENRFNGDGNLRIAETAFGTLSGVICWDTDFPGTVRQAGRNGTDILLSPSMEWRDIAPLHAHMAMVRAIENGVSVVRVADNGLSAVYDAYGRTLATMDHFAGGERVIVAQVPTDGVDTIYPIIGDLFGWLSVLGFAVLVIAGLIRGRRAQRIEDVPVSSPDLATSV